MPPTITTRHGQPKSLGKCRSCGQLVGWVRIPRRIIGDEGSRHQMIAVDLDPRAFGTIAVLEDGVRAVDLESFWIPLEVVAAIRAEAPSYIRHFVTCDARGMRHAGWSAAALVDGRLHDDPTRESRRAARLAADRRRDGRPGVPAPRPRGGL